MNKKIFSFILTCASAVTAFAQTFNYDPTTQTVVVSGDGPDSSQVEITNPNRGGNLFQVQILWNTMET